ncbi:CpaF family protein [Coprococcus eutactus]|jgi:pilus assembly protein CpaF|uniref:CpaF family protein n=1 Tax=Coprococcus hominis (ex Liu et al. 2022) TaxID=2763039 RepID=A0A8I0AN30_9FIRM|nr:MULTISPECIES: CpaF family protein [Clostridia]RHV77685.1 CpaF family protein [Clostridium sp. OF10-22XD]HAB87889.1 pilus assembly protein [Coprococcus sp.]MBC5661728.1 CpaF family protein [Coprococcus hominis (ex Liu et al. 2022)]MCB5505032.1 CpaF family protein [Coprococcus eutactus]NSC96832.1 CpaF family protein [Coprococcus eutactus]
MSQEIIDEKVLELIDRSLLEHPDIGYVSLEGRIRLRKELFNAVRRMDVLSDLLEDDSITEIMINGYDQIFVEKDGRIQSFSQSFESEDRLASIIQQIVAGCNRLVNEAVPIVDARLPDGSRVNVVLPPVALDGPTMTIRKFPKEKMTMERLIELGALDEETAGFLKLLVKARYNIFVSGGTGAGKTTFLNALSDYIPKTERIITIEDSAELQLRDVENLVRMETRNSNVEGENAITIRDLIKASLRMRPDRVIVGEVRDSAAIDMLTAMNTGHDGSLSTGHANSAYDMITRLESMVLMGIELPMEAVRRQIASAVDIIIHLGRLRDGSRKVTEICEVTGIENGQVQLTSLYEFEEQAEKGRKTVQGYLKKKAALQNKEKLKRAGLE